MFGLGTKEIIIIACVIVLLFGSKKIPELSQGIADAIRQLRKAFKDDEILPAQSNTASDTKSVTSADSNTEINKDN